MTTNRRVELHDAHAEEPRVQARRVSCGPAWMLSEGSIARVPLAPPLAVLDDRIGSVQVRSAVIARRAGRVYAYANLCRHVPLGLDLGDGEVGSPDRQAFFCHHHGARYRIEDGKCLVGPCDGKSLLALPTEEVDGELLLLVPQAPISSAHTLLEPAGKDQAAPVRGTR